MGNEESSAANQYRQQDSQLQKQKEQPQQTLQPPQPYPQQRRRSIFDVLTGRRASAQDEKYVTRKERKETERLLKKLQEQTGFDQVDVRILYNVFNEVAGDKGVIDREGFQEALGKLEEYGLKKLKGLPLGERLFDLFDQNHDGVLQLEEFISGLGVLCRGTDDQKIELTFKAFDREHRGYITKEDLLNIYTQTYHALLQSLRGTITPQTAKENEELEEFQDQLVEGLEKSFSDQMNVVSENIMNIVDTNLDGKLDLNEFKAFVKRNPFVKASYTLRIEAKPESVEQAVKPEAKEQTLTAASMLSYLAKP